MNENEQQPTTETQQQPQPVVKGPWFFHAENCNRLIEGGGYQFDFQPYDQLGGAWRGVFATQSEAQATALRALAGAKGMAIKEISQEDYARCLKKRNKGRVGDYSPLLLQPLKRAYEGAIAAKPAVVVENPAPSPETPKITSDPVADAKAAIKVAAVTVTK
jgi:hypothetical protein